MSDDFFKNYWLTITICSIFFVIYLIYAIIQWRKYKKTKKEGKSSKSYCPDYWTIGSKKKNQVTCVPPNPSTGITAKSYCLNKNKTWATKKDKKKKCKWAKKCQQQWYGIWDDNNSNC